jgi:adenosylhomocysteinase
MSHATVTGNAAAAGDFKVHDLGLAEWGRKEIEVAEQEMPGLMAVREKYGPRQAAQGRPHHRFPAHDDQTAVLIETLVELGADVRWASCNIFSTQDHAAAAIAAIRCPGLRVEGRNARGVLGMHLRR